MKAVLVPAATVLTAPSFREVTAASRLSRSKSDDGEDDQLLGGYQRNVQTLQGDLSFLLQRHRRECDPLSL
jgi:hypothetical protein